jgi:diguanylate cyclase (GGDEF)-like protein
MSETTRSETQLGIADLKRRLSAVGLNVIDQRERFHHDSTYFVIGTPENQTDIVLSREFLDDLPNTKDYHAIVDSYAHAVAGRLKCGSPEVFYCQSGVAIRVSIRWPIQSGINNNRVFTVVLMDVINQADGQIARCSMEVGSRLGRTVFDIVLQTVNSVRTVIDSGQVKFYEPQVHQEVYQPVEYRSQPQERHTQSQIEDFLAGKAYVLGFFTVDEPTEVWAVDPWDAQYLSVTVKELSLAMRVMRAKGLLHPGSSPEYARPTDKLLAERSSETEGDGTVFQSQQKPSQSNLPNKEKLLKDMTTVLEHHPVTALLVIDLDHFKSVNDTMGHLEGDACLDRVISTIGAVVGRKGKIYRWGGDEFAVCLPDFSTEEAQVTAERIRSAIEQAKVGRDVAVTASIGVCATDHTDSKSAEEILNMADKAMYESKDLARNRVTAWPLTTQVDPQSTIPKKRKENALDEERQSQIFSLISQLNPSEQAALKLLLLRSSMTEMVALRTLKQSGVKADYGMFDKLQRSTNLVRPVPGQLPTKRPVYDQRWEVTPEIAPLVQRYFQEHQTETP